MKIAVLGAAGVRTPLMIEAILRRQTTLGMTELALMDIDADRLDLIGSITASQEKTNDSPIKILRTTDPRRALEGADYVITTFRVGGMAARVVDERVALEYGILGQETTGPGGFAMAMRTIPVLLGYVDLMHQVCPQAWLINFANPAGMLAEAVLRVAGWDRAVGICDAPTEIQRVAAALLQAPLDDVYLDYFGLNHLGWVRSVIYRQENVLPQFIRQAVETGHVPGLPFSSEWIASLGMIPNEYMYYYYDTRSAVQRILSSEQTRGEQILELNEKLFADLARLRSAGKQGDLQPRYQAYLDARSGTYMKTETGMSLQADEHNLLGEHLAETEGYAGVALNLIEGLSGVRQRLMILNTLNHGAVAGMQDDDVVEIPAYVGKGFIRPMAVGTTPDHCIALMKQVKEYERQTIAAAVEGSYARALHALIVHPLVADTHLAQKILDGYRTKHGNDFPSLQ